MVSFDSGFVYTDGLLVGGRSAVCSVNSSLVYTNGFLERRSGSAVCSVDSTFVYANGFLDNSGSAVVAVDSGLGDVNVLAVAWLVSSTVLTLDLVNRAKVLVVDVVVMRVVIVVPVSVNLNPRIRVG